LNFQTWVSCFGEFQTTLSLFEYRRFDVRNWSGECRVCETGHRKVNFDSTKEERFSSRSNNVNVSDSVVE